MRRRNLTALVFAVVFVVSVFAYYLTIGRHELVTADEADPESAA